MQVSTANDVKVYNLSAGKNVPEWMSEVARKQLEKKNIDVRRRIQLIQNFEMPDMSTTVSMTKDSRYVFATGTYKPYVKCYDLNDLSMKFERGLSWDVIKLIHFSEDYTKFAALQQNRCVEIHASFGRYYLFRTPTQSRDFAFSEECSDLYFVGKGDQIFRLNLEQGEWLSPLISNSSGINCCEFMPDHQLFVCGTSDGTIEAYDHRDKKMAGLLDCQPEFYKQTEGKFSEVSCVSFKDPLHLAVGSRTGQIILYDIRSSRPLLVKDHYNELPIVKIDYVKREEGDLVLSMDNRVLKMWNDNDGSSFAAIESASNLTDFCRQPGTGLMFFANEAPKMQQYFVPSLGPAPKWCSFLEALTEELEESDQATVYDDFKFVTQQQLEDIGLTHLVGTNVLRAYMHGYFMNAKLYAKAMTATQPFAFKNFKERKIREALEKEREQKTIETSKVKLPKVNKEFVRRLQTKIKENKEKSRGKNTDNIEAVLTDERFKKLFESEDYEVDMESEIFYKKNSLKVGAGVKEDEDSENEVDSDDQMELNLPAEEEVVDEKGYDSLLESASEEETEISTKKKIEQIKAEKRLITRHKRRAHYIAKKTEEKAERMARRENKPKKFVLHDIDNEDTSRQFVEEEVVKDSKTEVVMFKRKLKAKKKTADSNIEDNAFGGKSMTFTLSKTGKEGREERDKTARKKHQLERKDVVRATTDAVARKLKRLPHNIGKGKRL